MFDGSCCLIHKPHRVTHGNHKKGHLSDTFDTFKVDVSINGQGLG